jgi:hypothetical protein
MTDRDRAATSTRGKRRTLHQPGRAPVPQQRDSQEPETEEDQGFLFDPYWDEVFAAYYDPTLHVCCSLKY